MMMREGGQERKGAMTRAEPFRTRSRRVNRAAREQGRGEPWEERAICIPNDRMTFARCIKMPLIDGARENTFDKAERASERALWTSRHLICLKRRAALI